MAAQAISEAQIGRYRIVRQLGKGGMAEVLLGVLEGSHNVTRPVVLKRILEGFREKEEYRQMFVDEARILSSLHHPNIVSVIELGSDGGHLFIAMEYLDGHPLSTLLSTLSDAGRTLEPELAAHIGAEACAALQAAHSHRDEEGAAAPIIHRDISPDNLFVTRDGGVKVIDFGIAKSSLQDHATSVGVVKGKLLYMAPEQLRARHQLDHRADLFALGATLLKAITSAYVYPGDSEVAALSAIQGGRVNLDGLADVPAELADVLRAALAPDPDDRFSDARAMREGLLGWLRSKPRHDLRSRLGALVSELLPRSAEAGTMELSLVDIVEGKATAPLPVETSARTRRIDPDGPLPPLPAGTVVKSAEASSEAPSEPSSGASPMATVQLEDLGTVRPDRRRLAWIAAAVVGLVVALAVFWPSTPTPAPIAPRPQRVSAPTPPPVEPAEPTQPRRVRWEIRSEPSGAEVLLRGQVLGRTPLRVERDAEPGKAFLELRRDDFELVAAEVDLSRDVVFDRALVSSEPEASASRSRPRMRVRMTTRMAGQMENAMSGGGFFRVE